MRPTARALALPLAIVVAVALAAAATATNQATPTLDPRACAPPFFGPGAGEGLNDPETIPPSVGTLRVAMLFLDFSDAPGNPDPRTVYDAWAPALADRYRTVSYGRLQIACRTCMRSVCRRLITAGTS